ncbi:MAG: gfo/Idh/MocA family oxidoreductase [Acidobacteria bacterium]|nr:MAG: gfo/Idh/MocA family oxidoreductase [Acidobacteriota bacterium]PYY09552.1 MAG: gfo/Idh/MocA family oxidoreductase [Acidobacteriota bacterium]
MNQRSWTRRDFMRIGTGAVATGVAAKFTLLEPKPLWGAARPVPASDTVRFASIGTGVRGCELLEASLRVPGAECVAVCDLYDSRHTAAQEAVKNTVPATRNYKEVLDRKDVDAVLLAVTDHQHRKVFVDACAAGKDVYCEKPMSHTVEDGFAMVEAAQKTNRIVQIGSQRVSSILYAQAKEIYDSGKLGEVYSIEAYWDRNSASGAWVYPIPRNASEQTIDWNAFLDGAPRRPFSPERFFRWRCFTDYGEGLAGDLFVHLISGIHFITGANAVAQRARSAGGLFRWKDGRDFPDLIETLYDYPNFRVYLRCNLNNDQGEFIGFFGTKGTLIIKDSTLTYTPQKTRPQPESYSIYGWPGQLRNQYLAEWEAEHPLPSPTNFKVEEEVETFGVPFGYSDLADHEANFFNSVRTRKKPVENEEFGNHAAIGCHLANYSYFKDTAAQWDGAGRKIKG